MRIKRLHIGDFGILRNQTLNDLNPGIVVVGGCNRAGKSTFMNVLKHLAYGFPKTGIPPANVRYMAEADFYDEDADKAFSLRVEGNAEPSVKNLYPVDSFTYSHLFVISLDQLTCIPEDVKSSEAVRLQSILLGAGLEDIAEIPGLELRFSKAASNMGGKSGDIREFKPFIEQISQGTALKKSALGKVDEYRELRDRLSSLKQQRDVLQEEIGRMQAEHYILEALRTLYDVFRQVNEVSAVLDNHKGRNVSGQIPYANLEKVEICFQQYKDMDKHRTDIRNAIAGRLDFIADTPFQAVVDAVIANRDGIEGYYSRLSGMAERWSNLVRLKNQAGSDMNDIRIRMKRLTGNDSDAEMERIGGLPLSITDQGGIREKVESFININNQLEQNEYRIEETTSEIAKLTNQQAQWTAMPETSLLRTYVIVFLLSAAAGLGIYFLHHAAGLFVGLFGILGSAAVLFMRSMIVKDTRIKRSEIEFELDSCRKRLAELNEKSAQLLADKEQTLEYFSEMAVMLGMQGTYAPSVIVDFYEAAADLQERISRCRNLTDDLKRAAKALKDDMDGLKTLLDKLQNNTVQKHTGPINEYDPPYSEIEWNEMQRRLQKWHDILKDVVNLQNISQSKDSVKSDICKLAGLNDSDAENDIAFDTAVEQYIQSSRAIRGFMELQRNKQSLLNEIDRAVSTDRVRRAFAAIGYEDTSTDMCRKYCFELFSGYLSADSLDMQFFRMQSGIDSKQQELEQLKKDIQLANDSLNRLALTTELENAHAMIDKGRAGLYPVAYRYAVLKAAAWLCETVRSEFLDKMRDELLSSAGSILRGMTEGEYKNIMPCDNLQKPDFSFVRSDGSRQESTDVLSRGTREQVFLAVRFGRIMDMKPALPVIIDDSFVNFDPQHLKNSVQVLADMSRTHQIFIMTCHPHLISLLEQSGADCQYWLLENGRFSCTDAGSLSDRLRRNMVPVTNKISW